MPEDSLQKKNPKLNIRSEKTGIEFDQKMKQIKKKEVEKLVQATAQSQGVPYVDLEGFPVSPEALILIPEKDAKENGIVCFLHIASEMRVASPEPKNDNVQKYYEQMKKSNPNLHIELYMISDTGYKKVMGLYKFLPKTKRVVRGVDITEEDLKKFQVDFKNFREIEEKIRSISTTELVTFLIAAGVSAKASDIRIEAEETGIKVRYRVDGILQDIATLDRDTWEKLDSRIKLLAGLKINIKDTPQDGRFSIHLTDDRIDVRISVLPTNFGESIVMRLLMSKSAGLSFKDLGLMDSTFEVLNAQIQRPNGMIITTGPTGSGKTTTLYAIINELNKPGVKIITIEEPIEYQLAGINQSQVDPKKSYTFASGLKSLMRQDPDIIMVGEIRDAETTDISIQASLTGHMVISTLHTNSAAGAIPRFLSLGAKPFLLAPALNAVIGQRLVRKLCDKCKQTSHVDPALHARAKEILKTLMASEKAYASSKHTIDLENLKFMSAVGCAECHELGYRGRVGVYEIFTMSQEIEKLILSEGTSEYDIQQIAVNQGMITMVQDGILKALDGVTSLDEVFRVTE